MRYVLLALFAFVVSCSNGTPTGPSTAPQFKLDPDWPYTNPTGPEPPDYWDGNYWDGGFKPPYSCTTAYTSAQCATFYWTAVAATLAAPLSCIESSFKGLTCPAAMGTIIGAWSAYFRAPDGTNVKYACYKTLVSPAKVDQFSPRMSGIICRKSP